MLDVECWGCDGNDDDDEDGDGDDDGDEDGDGEQQWRAAMARIYDGKRSRLSWEVEKQNVEKRFLKSGDRWSGNELHK